MGRRKPWQLRAAFDYSPDLPRAVMVAILAGAVEPVVESDDPDDDLMRLTEAYR